MIAAVYRDGYRDGPVVRLDLAGVRKLSNLDRAQTKLTKQLINTQEALHKL